MDKDSSSTEEINYTTPKKVVRAIPKTPGTPEVIRALTDKSANVSKMPISTGDTRGPGWTTGRKADIVRKLIDASEHISLLDAEITALRSQRKYSQRNTSKEIADLTEEVVILRRKNAELERVVKSNKKMITETEKFIGIFEKLTIAKNPDHEKDLKPEHEPQPEEVSPRGSPRGPALK
eukprot:TRINITY_DN983_c0_g1_i1.p1 TRINITY_DN983_c0_g1~~TRINITY_DN983_c0_g1_i1.p1  ORF type:complete len:179 (-),score=31.78 TRINITY_DN983_c0_g1_i1:69-605(-)